MKLTNRLNLPQPLVDAVRNDSYSNGGAGISVTTLLKPPRIVALEHQFKDQIEEDVSDRIWSLLGQVVHGILERADTTGVAERRLSIEVEGWVLSGQMDRYADGVLSDYKVVTAYKFKDGVAPEYVEQLNVYAEILRRNGHPVKRIEIVGILRDWSKMEAKRDPNYPQTQVVVRGAPLWDEDKVQKFIRDRVILHKQARLSLPQCSPEDRWARPTVYAVMKDGRKTAVKLYDNESDARSHASTDRSLSVQMRPGQNVRCLAYCPVSKYCSQAMGGVDVNEE